jgi:hypothetical protein
VRNIIYVAVSVLFVSVGGAPSWAADDQAFSQQPSPPEVGIGGEHFFPTYGDWFTDSLRESSANLRVTLPFTPRFAFEAIGTVGRRGDEFYQRTEGLYFLQVKQRLRRNQLHRFQPFITYGAAGYYAHVK